MTQENNVLKSGALTLRLLYITASLGATCSASLAAELPVPQPEPAIASADPITEYFATWYDRVHAAQESQPHWMTPLATVTPRLEQEYRYDQSWQQLGNGAQISNFFGGKGLEFIPTTTNEILINVPPFLERTLVKPATGFNDWPFFTVKQRLVSANEENGNYIVSAFLGVQAPTGIAAFTNHSWIVTPTLAAGKGWGDFDIQGTVGVPIPTSHEHFIGTSIVSNVTFQYHFAQYFWPEIEINDTYWTNGVRGGKNQIFLTPGIVLGRFPLFGTAKAVVGFGYQFAVSPELTKVPVLTPTYNRAWILSARVPF
jgi:hypothetical protein